MIVLVYLNDFYTLINRLYSIELCYELPKYFVLFFNRTTTSIPNGTTTLPNGSSSYGSQLSVNDVNGEAKDGLPANKPTTITVQPDVADPPAPIPAPSFVSLIRGQEKSVSNSNCSSSSSSSATVSRVYPSASDPVFVPTVSQHAGAAGTIKCEIGCQHEATEINNIQGNKHVPDDIDVSKIEKTAFEVPVSMHGNKSPSKLKAAKQVKESNPMESTSLQGITSFVCLFIIYLFLLEISLGSCLLNSGRI